MGTMPQEFDPYHRWLGIPPEKQPADHYRLLGLVRFEDDMEVIRDAAERQIGHVRRYGLGKHSELSQRILNELAAAKACLMDPDDKSAYDGRLRKEMQAAAPPLAADSVAGAPHSTTPAPPPPPPPPRSSQAALTVTHGDEPTRPARRPRGGAAKWLIGAGGALLVAGLALALVLGGKGEGQTPPAVAVTQDPAAGQPTITHSPQQQPPPRPPQLARIPDQTATEGEVLELQVKLSDPGSDPGPLLFSLFQAPSGVKIDAGSGVLTWTPSAGQAATKHAVTVQVVARDASELTDRISFAVDVREAARPPEIREIPQQRLEAGTRREVQVTATDPNRPPKKLKYSLVDAPAWVRIDGDSGIVTLEPPKDHKGGSFRAEFRVAGNSRNAPSSSKSLAIVVTPGRQISGEAPLMPSTEDLSGLSEIKGPSGSLDPSQMDMQQTANAAALNLMNRVGADPKVMPLFAGALGGPVAAVAELNKANRLDGVVIDFQPGKDPVSCLNARLQSALAEPPRMASRRVSPALPADGAGAMAPSAFQLAQAQREAGQAAWGDVRLRAYLEFKQGYRHGTVATWDAAGQRVFWGNYQRGNRDGFCCLFENDRPRIVVVFDQGKKSRVYLVANSRVDKSFASEEEAQRDTVAQSLLTGLDDLESRFKEGERLLESQIKRTIQVKLGNMNQYKRALEEMRRSSRDVRQKQGLQDLQKAATFR